MKPSFLFAFLTFAAWPGSLSGQIPVSFLEPRTFGSGWGQSIVVADFNADGALDVAMVGTDVEVYLGNGHGSFTVETPIGFSGTAIVAGDLNGDGIPDLAIASSTDLIVLPGKGNGTFGPPLAYPGNFTVLTLGDFNGDGILDVAAGTTAGQVQIFFGSAGGSLRPGPLTTLPVGRPLAIVAADFNLDHKADLAVTGLTGATAGIAGYTTRSPQALSPIRVCQSNLSERDVRPVAGLWLPGLVGHPCAAGGFCGDRAPTHALFSSTNLPAGSPCSWTPAAAPFRRSPALTR
jgi:hypothetical protein